jgi:hypothetical protein
MRKKLLVITENETPDMKCGIQEKLHKTEIARGSGEAFPSCAIYIKQSMAIQFPLMFLVHLRENKDG